MNKQIVFLLASTALGPLILSRLDWCDQGDDGPSHGVGGQLLASGNYSPLEGQMTQHLLQLRRELHGDGVVAIDCGANIGAFAVAWGNLMTGWGSVIAIEAQERLFYALCGNIALQNCFNVRAIHAAVSDRNHGMNVPELDYQRPASLGSLELVKMGDNADVGQPVDHTRLVRISAVALDTYQFHRCDFIKLDIEGMEYHALKGAKLTIEEHKPIILVEWPKAGKVRIEEWLTKQGYETFMMGGGNMLAVHSEDPVRRRIRT